MPGYWKRASERALSIDLDQIRDALRHSADDAELRIRLQKLLDERGDSGANTKRRIIHVMFNSKPVFPGRGIVRFGCRDFPEKPLYID